MCIRDRPRINPLPTHFVSGKATVNVDGGLEDIIWIGPWSRGRQIARGVLRFSPKLEKRSSFFHRRGIGILSCFFLNSSAQMCVCQTPGRRRPPITGHFVNSAVRGPALAAISVHAAVVCVPLLLCANWRQHTGCAAPRCC